MKRGSQMCNTIPTPAQHAPHPEVAGPILEIGWLPSPKRICRGSSNRAHLINKALLSIDLAMSSKMGQAYNNPDPARPQHELVLPLVHAHTAGTQAQAALAHACSCRHAHQALSSSARQHNDARSEFHMAAHWSST
eukprot:163466-Pelagomonas_calceolata.AAC.4